MVSIATTAAEFGFLFFIFADIGFDFFGEAVALAHRPQLGQGGQGAEEGGEERDHGRSGGGRGGARQEVLGRLAHAHAGETEAKPERGIYGAAGGEGLEHLADQAERAGDDR